MTKIIGHRGAAGLALENTLRSIELAREYGVDAIEFDVRRTKDNHIILCHDNHLARVSLADTVIAEINLEDLIDIPLHDGKSAPTLAQALVACGPTPAMVEIKDYNSAKLILNILADFPDKQVIVTSFLISELKYIRKHRPDIPLFLAEHFKPIEVVAHARMIGAAGITLNAWLLNPLTYYLARRHKLKIMVYTVNSIFIARFLQRLYPTVMICTDRPDRFKRRKLWQRITQQNKRNVRRKQTI